MRGFSNDMTESAARQLALDLNCRPEDFLSEGITIVPSEKLYGRRSISDRPDFFRAATFGAGTVISLSPEIFSFTKAMSERLPPLKLFDAPGIYLINKELERYGMVLGDFHEYYLPLEACKNALNPSFSLKIYRGEEIAGLYSYSQFQNALLFKNQGERRDVLAVAAFFGSKLAGIAGASNDSVRFWQIGVDVLPEFRKMGAANQMICVLTKEVLKSGAVPYYGTWWSNIASRRTAMSCGYYPVWSEMWAVPLD